MATREEVENSKQVAENTEKIKSNVDVTQQYYKESIEQLATQISLTRTLSQEIDDLLEINRRRTYEERTLLSIASTIRSVGSQNFELARRDNTLAKSRAKLDKTRASLQAELVISQRDATITQEQDRNILKDIQKLKADLLKQENISLEANNKLRELSGQDLITQKALADAEQAKSDSYKEQISSLEAQLSEEGKRVNAVRETLQVVDQIDESLKATEKTQRDVNKTVGITGELLSGVNKIGVRVLGGLGINLGVIASAFEDGKMAMDEFGLALSRSGKEIGTWDQFKALGLGMQAFSKNLPNLLTDPLSILTLLFSKFNEVDKEAVRFQRITGQTAPILDSINSKFATTTQYLQVASSLSERMGMNIAGAFSAKNLAYAAELMNTMGITAEAAGQLALVSEINGQSLEGSLDSIVGQVNAYNKNNRVAVNHSQIVNDIANASEETLASLTGQTTELAKAGAVARRLGMQLKDLERIADSLLDFESSIENELQAQLLTGMDINLNKARELALTNQIGAMGEEVFANTVDLEKFSRMNRIAQEGLAKALGMSRQELAKVALGRAIELGLSTEALENAAAMTKEEFQRTAAVDKLNISIQKIGQALAGPAAHLASFLSNTVVLNSVLGSIALIYAGKLVKGITTLVGGTATKLGAEKAMLTTTTLVTRQLQQQALLTTQIANNISRGAASSVAMSGAAMSMSRGAGSLSGAARTGAGAAAGAARVGAGSVAAGGAMMGAKLLGRTALRAIPYVGWALLAYDLISMLASSKPKEVEDAMIAPDGGLLISGPKGSIQLDSQDSIVAGTNLRGGSSQSNRELISKIDELIGAVKQGGDIYLDSDKVGTALTKGIYRNS